MTRDAQMQSVAETLERLRKLIKPGDTLFTQLKSVSRSGMSRVVQVFKIDCPDKYEIDKGNTEPNIYYLGYSVAEVCDYKYDRDREGVKVGGCGFDAGFDVVYNLSRVLFKDGFDCIGDGCPANDHVNGDRNYTPHHHSDPGYALKQRWL